MVVYLDEIESASSDQISVFRSADESWFGESLGNVNPVFLWLLVLMIIALVSVSAIYLKSTGDSSESLLSEEDHYLDGDHFHPQVNYQANEPQN